MALSLSGECPRWFSTGCQGVLWDPRLSALLVLAIAPSSLLIRSLRLLACMQLLLKSAFRHHSNQNTQIDEIRMSHLDV